MPDRRSVFVNTSRGYYGDDGKFVPGIEVSAADPGVYINIDTVGLSIILDVESAGELLNKIEEELDRQKNG